MIQDLGRRFPEWYRLLMDAQHGVLTDCPVLPDDLTRAFALEEEERRHDLAMGASEKYAAPYLRLGMEALGRVGQGARVQVQVNVAQIQQQRSAASDLLDSPAPVSLDTPPAPDAPPDT